jgi:hypothetical protein
VRVALAVNMVIKFIGTAKKCAAKGGFAPVLADFLRSPRSR